MAIIPKYSLNEKFENGKKPPQWDFWAWQDSYWHKDEKIPTSAIEGLDATLQKKADLVDGMVPESQLPFSVVTSEVIALGTVGIVDGKVKLPVHSSGANKVRVKGKLIIRTFPNEWPFTPIAGSGIKVLRGYAVKNEDDFFMVEGAELPEMTDPEIPENALQLFRLTISSAGVIVEEETEEVFKYRSDDNWRPLIINTNTGVWLQFGGTGASSFNITVSGFVTTPKIVGLSTKVTKNIWNGKDILLYIDSDVPVAIVKDQTLPTAPNATFINFAEDYILQPKSYNLIKQKGNQIVVVKYGGGSANFPAGGSDGEVLLKSGTGGIWSSIIKGVEFLGNAWLKLKLISFQGYTIAQKNLIASPVEGMLIYQNESPKGFQKYENAAWTAVGSNISNADLSNVSARTFTQGNSFTWNTAGFFHYLKGLADKTGNAAYTKVVIVHPTTGEMVTRDFADPAATTLAVQNANSTQKTAMRTALLGTAVPASPALFGVGGSFIKIGESTTILLFGLNLTLLDPVFLWIELVDGTKIYATNFSNVNQNVVRVTWLIPAGTPIGNYFIKIQNGVTVQGLSNANFNVVENYNIYDFPNAEWLAKADGSYTTSHLQTAMNYVNYSGPMNVNFAIKGDNVFSGALNSQWEFTVEIVRTLNLGIPSSIVPFIGLTSSIDSDFTSYFTLNTPNAAHVKANGRSLYDKLNNLIANSWLTTGNMSFYFSKPIGNKVYITIKNDTSFIYLTSDNLDSSVMYAFFLNITTPGNYPQTTTCYFSSKIIF